MVAGDDVTVTLLPLLGVVVTRYPLVGGIDGAIQDTSTELSPICIAVGLIGASPTVIKAFNTCCQSAIPRMSVIST